MSDPISSQLLADFVDTLSKQDFSGEIGFDLASKLLYSTDASIYQVQPLGVLFPRNEEDLDLAVSNCHHYRLPILARGSGSSLAGQAIGAAVILDCSRHMNRILKLEQGQDGDQSSGYAILEPGVLLSNLNKAAKSYGMQYGPDPASAERATIAGSVANNAAGAHSIIYGMAIDHLDAAEVTFSDGTHGRLASRRLEDIQNVLETPSAASDILSNLYRRALQIRQNHTALIKEHWPKTWRVASGYPLNYLIPWSTSQPPMWTSQGSMDGLPYPPIASGEINLACLLAGSEGTLAIMRRVEVRLVPLPKDTILAVIPYPSIITACEAVPGILESGPSAVELVPRTILEMARSVPAYAHLCSFIPADSQAILIVEYSGADPAASRRKASAFGGEALLVERPGDQRNVWAVRKVGLGLLNARHGQPKPVAFIEDLSVPVDKLGMFVRAMEQLLKDHGTTGEIYAHASAGCLHIRPILNLQTLSGVEAMQSISAQAAELTIGLGGSISGEHGDGMARSQWLEKQYGPDVIKIMRDLKIEFDPYQLLNPGKVVPSTNQLVPRVTDNLRYGSEYRTKSWQTVFDFSLQAGLAGAIDQCNGAAVCRKEDGLMCPSYQATRDEMHSTRGRANLLRLMISGQVPDPIQAEELVHQALDLCLACKGCKAECPSAVDMAKLRYEFTYFYYNQARGRRKRPLRDYLFGYIGSIARLGSSFAPLANPILSSKIGRQSASVLFKLNPARSLPVFASHSLQKSVHKPITDAAGETVFFLSDPFIEYYYPSAGLAALRMLESSGCKVTILPILGAGRTLISKGFLPQAKKHAQKLIHSIKSGLSFLPTDSNWWVVGVEPSEVYSLKDEFLDLVRNDPFVIEVSQRSFMIDEFLIRPDSAGELRLKKIFSGSALKQWEHAEDQPVVHLHGHCYQKAQPPAADGYPVGAEASRALLEAFGFQVMAIESGCCGMAGAFGYEAEHYALSMNVGEMALFPAIRQAAEKEGAKTLVAAAGISCQSQIQDGTGIIALHPIQIVVDAYNRMR